MMTHHHHYILILTNVTTIRSAPPGVLVVVSTANAQHLRLALASLPSGDHISIKIIIMKKKRIWVYWHHLITIFIIYHYTILNNIYHH